MKYLIFRINKVVRLFCFQVKCITQLLIFIFFTLIACSEEESTLGVNNINEEYQYTIPEQTNDGWNISSLSDEGINQQPISDMVNFIINESNHQIHNVLIIKNKKLVFEKYFNALDYSISPPSLKTNSIQYNREMLHWWASGSKSVTSVLLGIAINKGLLDSNVENKIIQYFPQYSDVLIGEKVNLTLKHLLTMSSGLDWDETTYQFGDQRNDVTRLFSVADPVKFTLSKNLHALPGSVFHYNSGVTNVIAEIICNNTNNNLLEFAKINLFEPLNILDYEWQKLNANYYFASGGLSLRPRDMAKIGLLFINEGKWNDIKLISNEWIDISTQSYINPNTEYANGYGFQWWHSSVSWEGETIEYFFAAGYGEQLMFIVPTFDLIIIFNCGYFGVPVTISPYQLIDNYIAPALFNN